MSPQPLWALCQRAGGEGRPPEPRAGLRLALHASAGAASRAPASIRVPGGGAREGAGPARRRGR